MKRPLSLPPLKGAGKPSRPLTEYGREGLESGLRRLVGSVHQEPGTGDDDSNHTQPYAQPPEDSPPGEQSDRRDDQPDFQKNFAQIKSIRAISLVANFRFHFLGRVLDSFLLILVARHLG